MLLMMIVAGLIDPALAPTTAQNDPSNPIGVVGGYWRPEAADELTIGWDRIIFDWSRFQPNGPGDFVADAVRPTWIAENQSSGREVVGLIINTPAWAAPIPNSGVPSGLFLPYNDPGNLWGVFLTRLAEQYAPQGVHRWIIWNHIDVPPFADNATFSGDVAEYVQMVKIAYQALNAIDEDAEVYLGGLDWWYDVAGERELYLSRFLARMAQDTSASANSYYFDGVTLNVVLGASPIGQYAPTVETIGVMISTTRQLLLGAGLVDKPIWINELGVAVTQDDLRALPNPRIPITPPQHADFLVQGLALSLANDVERIGLYRLFDDNFVAGSPAFGLLRDDNVPRPAYAALQYITPLFASRERVQYGSSTNARLVTFNQADQTVFVMWSAAETPVSFWIEQAFQDEILVTDVYGNPLPAPRLGVGPDNVTVHVIDTPPATPDPSGTVWVSGSPVIVVLNTSQARRVWGSLGDAVGIQLR